MEFIKEYRVVDIVIGVLLLAGGLSGLMNGLSKELAKAITVLVSILAGSLLYMPVGDILVAKTRLDGRPVYAVTFLLCMAAAMLLMRLIFMALRSVADFQFTTLIERIGGFVAGALRMLIFVAAIILVIMLWRNEAAYQHGIQDSKIAKPISRALQPICDQINKKFPDLMEIKKVPDVKKAEESIPAPELPPVVEEAVP